MSHQNKYCVVGLGEVLWDLLPSGRKLGGAPANFVYHTKSLGAESHIVSAVSKDASGKDILESLNKKKLDTAYVQINEKYPTGTVEVFLDKNGTPDYIIHENVAWDYIENVDSLSRLVSKTDCVCFGTLAQRSFTSRNTILSFLQNTKGNCLRIFDVNLRQKYFSRDIIEVSLGLSNCLKLNDSELQVIKDLFNISGDEETSLIKIIKQFELDLLALTKGENGSLLLSKNGRSYLEPEKVTVVDSVGAGDSFTAGLAVGYLRSLPLNEIHSLANRLASFVCSHNGATPELPDGFII